MAKFRTIKTRVWAAQCRAARMTDRTVAAEILCFFHTGHPDRHLTLFISPPRHPVAKEIWYIGGPEKYTNVYQVEGSKSTLVQLPLYTAAGASGRIVSYGYKIRNQVREKEVI